MSDQTTANEQDLLIRLFFRFLLCYAAFFAAVYWAVTKGHVPIPAALPFTSMWVLLALLGGFSKISSLYLLALTALKAQHEAGLLCHILSAVKNGDLRLWQANVVLLLLILLLFLYARASAIACRFAHKAYAQNLRLLFSRECAVFLLKSLCLTALALLIRFCLSRLADHFPW